MRTKTPRRVETCASEMDSSKMAYEEGEADCQRCDESCFMFFDCDHENSHNQLGSKKHFEEQAYTSS